MEEVEGIKKMIDYRYKKNLKEKKGMKGMGRKMKGGKGEDVVMRVKVGKKILEEEKEKMI